MAKIARFNGDVRAFGSGATGTDRTVFGDVTQSDTLDDNLNADFITGWGILASGAKPPKQYFNGALYTATQLIAYLHEVGVPEWNTNQKYYIDSHCKGSDGLIYKALTGTDISPNTGNDPISDAVNWELITKDYAQLSGATFTGQVKFAKGADIASATSLSLGTDGNYFDVTGTTAITSIGTTGAIGTVIKLHFDGILTLTHHATDLILPSGANIITASGDEAEFIEYAAGGFRCTSYTRASGAALISNADTRLNTADERYAGQPTGEEIVNANAGEWIKNQCTAWVTLNLSSATILDSFNVASIAKSATGKGSVTFAEAMDNLNYGAISMVRADSASNYNVIVEDFNNARTVNTFYFSIRDATVFTDSSIVTIFFIGGKS